jgi:hypothetical protein
MPVLRNFTIHSWILLQNLGFQYVAENYIQNFSIQWNPLFTFFWGLIKNDVSCSKCKSHKLNP